MNTFPNPTSFFQNQTAGYTNGKVEDIEEKLKSKYGKKIKTIYIDSSTDTPKIVKTEDAKAWQYLVNESQFVSILEKIYEYIEKHYKSSSIRTNQINEISVITKGLRDSNFISKRQSDRVQGIVKRLQRRVSEGERPQLESNGLLRLGLNEDNESSNLKALLTKKRNNRIGVPFSLISCKTIS